jgi:VWFA-related protein
VISFLLSNTAKLCGFLFLAGALNTVCAAQEPFPGEPVAPQQKPVQTDSNPPPPIPDDQYQIPAFRVNTSVVLVPTLVEKSGGDVVYGLQSKDFTLLDNGVPQTVHVDDDQDSQPISLLICVERGRDAPLEFDMFARLGPLLQLFLGDEQNGNRDGEAALVTFDSHPVYVQGFQKDTTELEKHLENLSPGDGGAAILDAVGYSVNLLEQRPDNHRRVLLLISETRDHGSRHVTIPQLVERIGTSNTLVLSLAFSPSNAEMIAWAKGNPAGDDGYGAGGLIAPLLMSLNAMRRNSPKALAEMSGGEYAPFNRDKAFERRFAEEAKHARNRYLLSFHPTDLTPGLHTIEVKLTQDYGAHVVARESYWAVSDAARPVP